MQSGDFKAAKASYDKALDFLTNINDESEEQTATIKATQISCYLNGALMLHKIGEWGEVTFFDLFF